MKILFVCDSNIRRSQMAETIGQVKYSEHEFRSVGLAAIYGAPNCSGEVKEQLGNAYFENIFNKRSKQINERFVEWADLIFTMSEVQVDKIKRDYPEAYDKTYTLKEWIGESKFGFSYDTSTDISPKDMMGLVDKAMNKIDNLTLRNGAKNATRN